MFGLSAVILRSSVPTGSPLHSRLFGFGQRDPTRGNMVDWWDEASGTNIREGRPILSPRYAAVHDQHMDELTRSPVDLPADFPNRLAATIANWKRKLLDLSRRNRALNFKPTKVSTIAIVDEQPAEVFRRMYLERVSRCGSGCSDPEAWLQPLTTTPIRPLRR